jgi:hypothetical protein
LNAVAIVDQTPHQLAPDAALLIRWQHSYGASLKITRSHGIPMPWPTDLGRTGTGMGMPVYGIFMLCGERSSWRLI